MALLDKPILLDLSRSGNKAEELKSKLHRLIVGQYEAIENIVSTYEMHATGMAAPRRPIGSFLFLGPTGSGKTRIVEATAESLTGFPEAVVKIDCAEFQEKHEIAKLIGSPPGYLGHRETNPILCEQVLCRYFTYEVKVSFLLFDEIEKASDALWNLLLGILDKARVTLGDNRSVDFSQTMIFMTSNLGAAEMSALINPRLGFGAADAARSAKPAAIDEKLALKISKTGTEAARRRFTPEFINRIDKIVVFKTLGEAELRRILDIELEMVLQRVLKNKPEQAFVFALTAEAKDFILREGTDLKYGARHLKRAIERLLVRPLASLIATDQIRKGDFIKVDYKLGEKSMAFSIIEENIDTDSYADPDRERPLPQQFFEPTQQKVSHGAMMAAGAGG